MWGILGGSQGCGSRKERKEKGRKAKESSSRREGYVWVEKKKEERGGREESIGGEGGLVVVDGVEAHLCVEFALKNTESKQSSPFCC